MTLNNEPAKVDKQLQGPALVGLRNALINSEVARTRDLKGKSSEQFLVEHFGAQLAHAVAEVSEDSTRGAALAKSLQANANRIRVCIPLDLQCLSFLRQITDKPGMAAAIRFFLDFDAPLVGEFLVASLMPRPRRQSAFSRSETLSVLTTFNRKLRQRVLASICSNSFFVRSRGEDCGSPGVLEKIAQRSLGPFRTKGPSLREDGRDYRLLVQA